MGFANSIRFVAGSRPFSASAGVSTGLAAGAPRLAQRPGWWRWHARLGAIPLAGYVAIHLGAQIVALSSGPEQRALQAAWEREPFWDVVVLALVLLPLVAHAALGLWRVAGAASDTDRFWPPPVGRALQRASALVLAVFLAAHVWQFQGRRWLGELERIDYFSELCSSLSSTVMGGIPLVAIGYLLGVAAVALHLAQGLYHAALSWGLVSAERQRWLGKACWLGGVSLFGAGALLILRLATGALTIGLPAAGASGAGLHGAYPALHN